LHLNGILVVRHDKQLVPESTLDGLVWRFDPEAYQRDLRKMTDSELIDESQSHRCVTGLLILLKPWFLIKLGECRSEWRRRRPQITSRD
jgi:hypothetical protein